MSPPAGNCAGAQIGLGPLNQRSVSDLGWCACCSCSADAAGIWSIHRCPPRPGHAPALPRRMAAGLAAEPRTLHASRVGTSTGSRLTWRGGPDRTSTRVQRTDQLPEVLQAVGRLHAIGLSQGSRFCLRMSVRIRRARRRTHGVHLRRRGESPSRSHATSRSQPSSTH